MSLFMDCSDAGYSNMDLDLVKFIISLFKQFYPMKLGSIYVHEMPWVMNAAWGIIKAWLSPAARNKMRFVNKDSVMQHFNRNQLSVRYGLFRKTKFRTSVPHFVEIPKFLSVNLTIV